ncbi:unnamed protein product [Owenia fusiformis]|uniref:Uncharacterized protein n=1 Tax=Owenia fusiformis TaxID=6347 RepID=A0A8J1U641_OWEFU|nr:unnamed protein product [Owenia fusiformis]
MVNYEMANLNYAWSSAFDSTESVSIDLPREPTPLKQQAAKHDGGQTYNILPNSLNAKIRDSARMDRCKDNGAKEDGMGCVTGKNKFNWTRLRQEFGPRGSVCFTEYGYKLPDVFKIDLPYYNKTKPILGTTHTKWSESGSGLSDISSVSTLMEPSRRKYKTPMQRAIDTVQRSKKYDRRYVDKTTLSSPTSPVSASPTRSPSGAKSLPECFIRRKSSIGFLCELKIQTKVVNSDQGSDHSFRWRPKSMISRATSGDGSSISVTIEKKQPRTYDDVVADEPIVDHNFETDDDTKSLTIYDDDDKQSITSTSVEKRVTFQSYETGSEDLPQNDNSPKVPVLIDKSKVQESEQQKRYKQTLLTKNPNNGQTRKNWDNHTRIKSAGLAINLRKQKNRKPDPNNNQTVGNVTQSQNKSIQDMRIPMNSKSLHPVTDGLRTNKQNFSNPRVIRMGDMNVVKVWPRVYKSKTDIIYRNPAHVAVNDKLSPRSQYSKNNQFTGTCQKC